MCIQGSSNALAVTLTFVTFEGGSVAGTINDNHFMVSTVQSKGFGQ